jgi:Holliday junction resolvase RusA-like endonuclease
MADSVSFSVPGRIRGQGRPRFTVKSGHAIAFTDAKTRSDAAMIRSFASDAMVGKKLLEGPLKLAVTVIQHPPKSWSKKRKATTTFVTGKPDCSNKIKGLEDAMNHVVYNDDSQISIIEFARFYNENSTERVEVTVTALNGTNKIHQQELEPA